MRIVFAGGGTGGHFYPIVAVAREINARSKKDNITAELFYLAPDPYDLEALKKDNIKYIKIPAGKIRKYFSILNFTDIFKTLAGIILSLWHVFIIYPDVVFSKGGFASFPVVFAARLLFIPVVLHESDSVPGKVNKWTGKFAKRIAISFPDAIEFFPKEKTAYTGNPIRQEILNSMPKEEALNYFGFKSDLPVIFVIGGSQGAQAINEMVLGSLEKLLDRYQVIHQTGIKNFESAKTASEVLLKNNSNKERYKIFGYLKNQDMKAAFGGSDLVISRAGSGIFEIATWGIPAILIPIPEPVSHDQTRNAYSYAREGAGMVIEESNFNESVFLFEIEKLLKNQDIREKMKGNSKKFVKPEAAGIIAEEIFKISLSHELNPKKTK